MTKILVTGRAPTSAVIACKTFAAAGYTPIFFDNLSAGNDWGV